MYYKGFLEAFREFQRIFSGFQKLYTLHGRLSGFQMISEKLHGSLRKFQSIRRLLMKLFFRIFIGFQGCNIELLVHFRGFRRGRETEVRFPDTASLKRSSAPETLRKSHLTPLKIS